jgi:hypothetical protein
MIRSGERHLKKVAENIDLLLNLKKKGIFKGEVSVNCVISEAMAERCTTLWSISRPKASIPFTFAFPGTYPNPHPKRWTGILKKTSTGSMS